MTHDQIDDRRGAIYGARSHGRDSATRLGGSAARFGGESRPHVLGALLVMPIFLLICGISFAEEKAEAAAPAATPAVEAAKPVEAVPLVSLPVKLVSRERAKPPALEPSNVAMKTVYGEVGLKNDNGISLVFERDEAGGILREVWFPFEADITLKGYESVNDLKVGDLVSVTYEETVDIQRRALKKIGLERTTEPKKPEPPAEVVSVSFLREQRVQPKPTDSQEEAAQVVVKEKVL